MVIYFVVYRQLPVIVEHGMVVEWVRTIVIRSVVVTVTVLSEVMSLVIKDEGELCTNVDEGLLELSVKSSDVCIPLDDSSLPCVRDCEGDSEGDCKEVGKGDRKEIAGSSVDEKRD